MDNPPRIGVSACLLGRKVRYDGGHKHDRYITETLGPHMEFVPVCPEVEAGYPIPRDAFRLVGDPADPRLIITRTGEDCTERLRRWSMARVGELAGVGLNGYIFKSKSPNSGLERVKVYPVAGGPPMPKGVGIFARVFMERFPRLPVIDEGRLNDSKLRETFIEAVFVMHRWSSADPQTPAALMDFHTRHKLLVFTHSEKHYRQMGPLVAAATSANFPATRESYLDILAAALRLPATRAKNTCALEKTLGYFRKLLSPDEKRELLDIFSAYKAGHYPLIVPVTLVNHYVRKYEQPYLRGQYFLNPHPRELQLRNHV